MSIVNQIPKSEDGFGVKYTSESGNIYIISHNTKKERFTLWKEVKNSFIWQCQKKKYTFG